MEGEICEGCTAGGKNWMQKVEITDNVLLIVLGNRANSRALPFYYSYILCTFLPRNCAYHLKSKMLFPENKMRMFNLVTWSFSSELHREGQIVWQGIKDSAKHEKNVRQNWIWSKCSSDLPGVGTYIIPLRQASGGHRWSRHCWYQVLYLVFWLILFFFSNKTSPNKYLFPLASVMFLCQCGTGLVLSL